PASDCLRLIMLTGCRPGEAMHATCTEFDEIGYWENRAPIQSNVHVIGFHFPPPRSNSSANSGAGETDSEFLFPGRVNGRPLREIGRCWAEVSKGAGLQGTRVDDLLRSYAAIGAAGGLSLQILGKLLGHSVPATTMRYAHLSDDPSVRRRQRIGGVVAGAG